jgi:predicted TIM-barrel fold metal-dependent hydrolase
MKTSLLLAAVALIVMSGCRKIAPSADHHQHLMSPAAVAVSHPPPLPAVELPQDLAQLLKERGERAHDRAGLRDLYTNDPWVLGYMMPGWGGASDAFTRVTALSPGSYTLTPVLFRTHGPVSSIAGYYTRGEGEKAEHFAYFQLTVERSADGKARISSEMPSFPIPPVQQPVLADDLIEQLDEAGIGRAVVLSNAYYFDGLVPVTGDPYTLVRAENDWTAAQVMRHPGRLVALCSFNPTRDHALAELERCAKNPAFTGVKLHFGTSPVDLDDPEHVAKTRRVFEAANRLRLPLLIHTSGSPRWGKEQAETFLNQLVAAAPDVQVVNAHFWGGAFYNEPALAVLADAVSSGNPAAKNLHFELSSVYGNEQMRQTLVRRMRQIGLERLYFGSDAKPRDSWEYFRREMPLTKEELERIAGNVAPWAQRRTVQAK